MLPSHEQDQANFQRELDGLANNAALPLLPREYSGPVVLKHALAIDGQGSTIWALSGPVVSCQAAGITLRNLRLEVTGATNSDQSEHNCALKVERGYTPRLENVEVRGTVIGIPEEEGAWSYPHSLQIGSVPFGREHDLVMRIWVPVPCEISSKISGIEVQPHRLEPGTNEITLHIERIAKDTLLSGKLYISTPHLRRCIVLNGYVTPTKGRESRSKKAAKPRIIYEAPDWETLILQPRPPYPAPAPPPPEPVSSEPVVTVSAPPSLDPEITVEAPTSQSTVVPPAEDTRPSGPSIRWPPPPPPIKSEVIQPAPVVEPPIVEPPTSTGPLPAPGPVRSPRQSPIDLLKSYPRAATAALASIGIIAIAVTIYLLIPRTFDPTKIKEPPQKYQASGARTVAFSPDAKMVASGSDNADGVVVLWDVKTMTSQTLSPKRSEITSLMFSPNGNKLVAGTADGRVIIWDVQTKDELNFRHNTGAVNSVAFSPDSNSVVSGGDDQIKIGNLQTNQQITLVNVKNTTAVAFSPDGKTIASGNAEGDVQLWDAKSGSAKQTLPKEHSGPITSLAFSSDGSKLVSASKDTKAMLWDVQKGEKLFPFRHNTEVSAVAFCNGDQYFVTRSGGSVLIWGLDSIQAIRTLEAGSPAKPSSNGVAVSGTGKIASGSSDGNLILWDQ